MTFLTPDIFRAGIPLPATAPPGNYDVEVALFADTVILARTQTHFEMVKTGFEQQVGEVARDWSLLYGVATAAARPLLRLARQRDLPAGLIRRKRRAPDVLKDGRSPQDGLGLCGHVQLLVPRGRHSGIPEVLVSHLRIRYHIFRAVHDCWRGGQPAALNTMFAMTRAAPASAATGTAVIVRSALTSPTGRSTRR